MTDKLVELKQMKARMQAEEVKEKKKFTKAAEKVPQEKTGVKGLTGKKILDGLHSNEDGDAWLFNAIHKNRYIYDHAAEQWHEWQGHYWQEDETNWAMYGINSVIDVYGKLADQKGWEETKLIKAKAAQDAIDACREIRAELLKRIRSLQTATRKRNVLFLATLAAGLTGREWDLDPWLLGTLNGVIDLRTGKKRPGEQKDYIKSVAPTECNCLNEKAPTWDQFLKDTFDKNQELISYLQRLMGYAITGLKREHVIPVLYGKGRNGKGTFLETIKSVLGPLAHKCRSEALLDSGRSKPSGSADADTLAFKGKRIVFAAETAQGSRLNAGKIKELAGGDTLNARGVYGRRPVEFEPTHLLLLMTNNKPQVPASDYAIWQRIHLIPFTLSFIDNPNKTKNERQADKDLSDKLKKEAPGILAWLLRGCLAWQKEGLNPPVSVTQATNEYQREMDLIGQFIDARCVTKTHCTVQAGKLYKAYESWCQDMGYKPFSNIRFGKEMQNRYEKDPKEKRLVFYMGIGLKIEPEN